MKALLIVIIASTSFLHAEEPIPGELNILMKKKEKAIENIETKYRSALGELMKKYMREGKSKEAQLVSEHMENSKKEAKENAPRCYKWGTGGFLILLPDGVAKHSSWEKDGSWTQKKNGEITLTSYLTSFTIKGHNVKAANGRRTTVTPL